YDDVIDGGDGKDVLFGQRGNDVITGGTGDDTIFGDRATSYAGFATDLPAISNAFRIVGAAQGLDIELPVTGELVVPAVNLLPWEITPYLPQIDVFPDVNGALAGFAERTDIARDDSRLKVFASVLADVTRASGLAYGDDNISGN